MLAYRAMHTVDASSRAADEFRTTRRHHAHGSAGPDGCPWDREQTIHSLRGFVLEETYEVLDAIDRERSRGAPRRDRRSRSSKASSWRGSRKTVATFRWPTRCSRINEKLVRRHPHVFGERRRAGEGRHSRQGASSSGSRSRRASRGPRASARRCSRACRSRCPRSCARTRSARASRPSGSTGRPRIRWWTRSKRKSPSCAAPSAATRAASGPRRKWGPALLDRQPVAQAGDRAGVGAAQGEREVQRPIRGAGAGIREAGTSSSGRDARGAGGGVGADQGARS